MHFFQLSLTFLQKFYLSLFVPMYEKIGFVDSVHDSHLVQRKRASILNIVCDMGHPSCVEKSVDLYKKWMSNPTDKT